MQQIPIEGGWFAMVNDKDAFRVSQYEWHLDKDGNVVTRRFARGRPVTMARLILEETLDAQPGMTVMLKSDNLLDNRQSNFRVLTVREKHLEMAKRNEKATAPERNARVALEVIDGDLYGHEYNPDCKTCTRVSYLTGKAFGCFRKARETEEAKP